MSSLLEIGLANAVCATFMAALVLAASRCCRRPAILHGLWLLVLLKLVSPPLLPLTLAVLPAPEPPVVIGESSRPQPPIEEPVTTGQFLLMPAPEGGDTMVVAVHLETAPWPAPPAPAEPAAIVVAEPSTIDWDQVARILLAAWIGGSGTWFLLAAVRTARFHALLRHATPASPELQARAAELAARLGLKRCPPVALIPGPLPPMLWMAVGSPTVYLPAGLLDQLEPAGIDSLLAHELAHMRRRDHWVRWLEFIVQGLYWWNPLVPLARRQLQAHEEECCDALVVNVMPPRPYATAIVRTLDFLAGAEPLAVPVSGLSRVTAMKQRLTRIMRGGVAGRLGTPGRVGIAALAIAALPLLPTLARPHPERRPEPPTETVVDEQSNDHWNETHRIDDTATGEAPRTLAYSPDGMFLALGCEDGRIELCDPATGEARRTFRAAVGPIHALAWSSDGQMLAGGGHDRTVRLWHVPSGQLTATLRGHGHWIYALAFAPDGRTLASGGYDRTIRLWDATEEKALAVLRGHTAAVRSLTFAPDGRTLASGGSDAMIRLWDVPQRHGRRVLTGHAGSVRALAYSPDGRTLASGSDDGTSRLWDAENGTSRASLPGQSGEITSLAFAPWGQVLATAGHDRQIRLWSIPHGRELGRLPAPPDGVSDLGFSPATGALTVLGQDGQIRHQRLARLSNLTLTNDADPKMTISTMMNVGRWTTSIHAAPGDRRRLIMQVVRPSEGGRPIDP